MSDSSRTTMDAPLASREIIVGVCGGIAAYKVAEVVSKLVQAGAGVTVCMTAEAQQFVTPLTFEALSGRKVRTGIFDLVESSDPQHISLTERADLMVRSPDQAVLHRRLRVVKADVVALAAVAGVVVSSLMQRRWQPGRTCRGSRRLPQRLCWRARNWILVLWGTWRHLISHCMMSCASWARHTVRPCCI